MRRFLCVIMLASLSAVPVQARNGDPDQPQVLNPWCAGCAAGFWWLCPGCNGLGPKGWALGDWF